MYKTKEQIQTPEQMFEIVLDVINNPQNWRLDEIITKIDNSGRAEQAEVVLVNWNAQLDYDQQGKLNFENNPIYRWLSFSVQQRFEIKKILNISVDYLTDDEKNLYSREQEILAFLIRQRNETKHKILGTIEEVVRFETWWNKNLATVVNLNYYYQVFLLVYEKEQDMVKVFPESSSCDNWGNSKQGRKKHSSSLDAQNEASWLKNELTSSSSKYYNNPIFLIHPNCDSYCSFTTLVKNPYVSRKEISERGTRTYIDWGDPEHGDPGGYLEDTDARVPPSDPDKYLKPLDLIKVGQGDYEHVGIYLGNGKVCDFSKKCKGTRIHNWREFFESYYNGTVWLGNDDIVRYRSIIPFKHYKKIIKQIAWTVDVDFRKNNYDLANRNCEHFANMMVYGINYSEQIEKNKSKIINTHRTGRAVIGGLVGLFAISDPEINNGKGSTIKLTNEINETNNKLGEREDNLYSDIEARIEIPSKEYCRIM